MGNSDFQSTTWMSRQPGFERTQVMRRQEVLSGTDRHRQHGVGTIVEKKKGDGIWWGLSLIILIGMMTSPYWIRSFFAWVRSFATGIGWY